MPALLLGALALAGPAASMPRYSAGGRLITERPIFTLRGAARTPAVLGLALLLITVGYGLAVPSLSALFSHVPMQQGVMQGIAGSADRYSGASYSGYPDYGTPGAENGDCP